jgi:hypothetical protein
VIQKTSVVPVRCIANLYDSDQVCDQLGREIVDHYSALGLLVLCGRQARSVIVENLTCIARGGANHY